MSEHTEKTDSTIKSKVPGEQRLRGDYVQELQNENPQGNNVAIKDYSVSPVITVTKEESTFTKGDLKLQKVIVSEDISDETEMTNKKVTLTETTSPIEVQTEVHSEVTSVTINTDGDTQTTTGEQKVVYKVTKIPKLKLKQAVDKIKKDEEMIKDPSLKDEATLGLKTTEAKLKEKPLLQESSQLESIKQDSPKVDDEFDKIYDQIFENGPPFGNFPSPGKIEDPDKLEKNFEEIIHAYVEQKAQISNAENIKSKIPLLKRKSEHDIYATKQTVRKNSLKKRNSIDDAKCKIPVLLAREKQNVEFESFINSSQTSQNKSVVIESKTVSDKNVTVLQTVKTNTSETITTASHQKNGDIVVTKETESNLIPEVSKSKIPTQLEKIVTVEKVSDIQTSEISSQLSIEKRSEDILINIVNKHETQVPETVVREDILNIKDNISNIKIEPLIITDNLENVPSVEKNGKENSNDYNEKYIKLNITIENDTDKGKQVTETETKSHIITVDEKNIKPLNDSTQNEKPTGAAYYTNDLYEKNTHTENNISKIEVEKTHVTSTVLINQKIRETVRLDSLQFSNPEKENIQQDKLDKISDNITNGIPKDTLHVSVKDVNLVTNPLDNNHPQEIKFNDIKNILSDEIIINNNNMNSESIYITERVNLKIQDDISEEVSRHNHEINSNNLSQQYNINRLESESKIKTLDSYLKTSREAINTENNINIITNLDTNQDNAVLITNQYSEAKVQNQDLTKEVTNNLTSQEQLSNQNQKIYQSESISETLKTEINNNDVKTEVIKDNKEAKVIAITNNPVNTSDDKGKDTSELEEEDIIMLKGKVNRIISRLDSKESKVNKYELDDVPRKVSVVSKIAIFEQSKSAQKASFTKYFSADKKNLDKPKIVDGLLKIENDSLQNDSKFSYDTFLNYKKSISHNISLNENETSQDKPITKFDKIYKSNINLNNVNKNKVGWFEEEVFIKKDEEDRNIINKYKMNKEIDLDMRRAKSLAELNGDGVIGRVRQMVVRMNSIDKMALERREQNEVRKKTAHGPVSGRIAAFEQDANEKTDYLMKKVTLNRMKSVLTTAFLPKPEEIMPTLSEEELNKRITELSQVGVTSGRYENMRYIELSDGGRLPSLTVGTALLDSKLIKPIIKTAIDLGYRGIDTAYIYGNEQAVGEAIREKIQDGTVKREELFVLAKLWSTNHRRDLAMRACQQSLDIMGLKYFDLYLIHNPMSFKEGSNPVPKIANVLQYSEHDYMEAWFGIEDLINKGLVKRGGVSNFNSVQVERVLEKGKIKPVVNQVECHPYLSQTRLQDHLSSRGVALSCFGCLGSSGTPKAFRSALPPVIHDPLVRTMAAGLGVTPAQLLISYQLSLGRGVVVKASKAAHLWDNIHALGLRLAPAHATALAALNRNKRTFIFEGMGDTHKNYPFKIPF